MTKRILILGAGDEQVRAISTAKDLGYLVTAFDSNADAPGSELSDAFAVCDIRDDKAVLETLALNKTKIDGVFCHAVEMSVAVSKVAKALNLPGIPVEVAINSTDKFERLKRLSRAGIPVAEFHFCQSLEEVVTAAEIVGYPLIIKPINSAGSRGVARCTSKSELRTHFVVASNLSPKGVLVEREMQGLQLSTESVVYGGVVRTFVIADRNYSQAAKFWPNLIEDGINFPSSISEEMSARVDLLIKQTTSALGLDFGAAKGDLIIESGELKVIEMASRTSGGWFGVGCITAATGINPLVPLIQMHLGDEPDFSYLIPRRNLACAQRYLIPRKEGILRSVEGIDKLFEVDENHIKIPNLGSHISMVTDHSHRFGSVICTDTSLRNAVARCERAISKISLEIS